jgi:hypothetical protein
MHTNCAFTGEQDKSKYFAISINNWNNKTRHRVIKRGVEIQCTSHWILKLISLWKKYPEQLGNSLHLELIFKLTHDYVNGAAALIKGRNSRAAPVRRSTALSVKENKWMNEERPTHFFFITFVFYLNEWKVFDRTWDMPFSKIDMCVKIDRNFSKRTQRAEYI